MSALFVVATPFMPDVPHLPFLLGGIGYSAFLAVCGVGFALLGPRIGRPLLFSFVGVSVCLMLAVMLPLCLLRERGLSVLDWVLPVAQPVISVVGVVFIAVSLYGWIRYYRDAH